MHVVKSSVCGSSPRSPRAPPPTRANLIKANANHKYCNAPPNPPSNTHSPHTVPANCQALAKVCETQAAEKPRKTRAKLMRTQVNVGQCGGEWSEGEWGTVVRGGVACWGLAVGYY